MELIITRVTRTRQYQDVTVQAGGTCIDWGIFDPCEANQLAHDLILAAEELRSSDHNEDIEKLAEIRDSIGG